jgi:hypothetical protein
MKNSKNWSSIFTVTDGTTTKCIMNYFMLICNTGGCCSANDHTVLTLHTQALDLAHKDHLGISAMHNRLRGKDWWRGMDANVENFVLCEDLQCQSTGSINLSRNYGMYSLTNSGLGYKWNWFYGFSAFWSSFVLWNSQISWSHSHKGNDD